MAARDLFTFDSLDQDFFGAFTQTRTALSDYMAPLEQLPDTLSNAVSSSASLHVQATLDAASNAWAGLHHLRARLTNNNIFLRASAVTLMANEAVLSACIESLAAYHSVRDLEGDTYLSALNRALWSAIDMKTDTRVIAFTHAGNNFSIPLSASPRSLRSDFERQRLVYTAGIDLLCERIGVADSRLLRLRSWVVWCVVGTTGFDALYHKNVWLAWQYPHTRCTDTRMRKEPSLDGLLPLLGHLSDQVHIPDRSPSALACLAVAVCTPDERARVLSVSRWFSPAIVRTAKCSPAIMPSIPARTSVVYRSLAVLDRLIGVNVSIFLGVDYMLIQS